jgi:hypothetical protein
MQLLYSTGNLTVTAGALQFFNIPQNFAHLEIRYFARDTSAGAGSTNFIRVSTDNVNIDTTGIYDYHYLRSSGVATNNDGATATGYMNINDAPASGAAAGAFGATIATIYDYSTTGKFKVVKSKGGWVDSAGAGWVGYWSGTVATTSAIRGLQIGVANNVCAIGTRYDIYGIPKSGLVTTL